MIFESHQGLCNGGILFLLPALLSQGLLKTKEVYKIPDTHYYGLESVVLTLAFMALARIRNPEQLKQCRPGEIGRLIGLDRTPEVSCLRDKIKLLSSQKQAHELNRRLMDHWYNDGTEDQLFMYIDGHVRIYFGDKANLPVKYVSRQKLCLNATTEYWVNDAKGQPVMMVMGELTEKLQEAIEHRIIPQLQQTVLLPCPQPDVSIEQENIPLCTLVFDGEGYQPAFFQRLWVRCRIAVITYRKNVKDSWPQELFNHIDVMVLDQTVTMRICEQKITLGGITFREIRRLTDSGHQTSIITNHLLISPAEVAGRMFGRWSQENFFRYMIMDYDFDKMIEFGTQTIDENKTVVNPKYRQLTHLLKKEKEKTNRLRSDFLRLTEQSIDAELDDISKLEQRQAGLTEKIETHQLEELRIETERNQVKARITLKEMPDAIRYNQLKPESKMLMNIIKMICYRAETSVANILAEHLRDPNDKRMLVKQIIQNNADICPDIENNTLTITLHGLSAPRFNKAAASLANLLNQTDTIFPSTNLRLIFKTTAY
jgi:hypothetical protein